MKMLSHTVDQTSITSINLMYRISTFWTWFCIFFIICAVSNASHYIYVPSDLSDLICLICRWFRSITRFSFFILIRYLYFYIINTFTFVISTNDNIYIHVYCMLNISILLIKMLDILDTLL